MQYLDLAIRILGSFITLFIVIRLLGKKQFGQLTFIDYAIGLALGTMAGGWASNTRVSGWNYFFAVIGYTVMGYLASYITRKYRPARKLLFGEPTLIIQSGKINEKGLVQNNMSLDGLRELLRLKGVFKIDDVEYALLEPNGDISILKEVESQPVTPKILDIPTQNYGLPSELIVNGQIIEQNLVQHNLSMEWLEEKLREKKVSVSDVAYASVNDLGQLYMDLRNDNPENKVEISD